MKMFKNYSSLAKAAGIHTSGQSKIIPYLKQPAGVATTKAPVNYVVTGFRIAGLYGKNLKERASMLKPVAHLTDQNCLNNQIHKRFSFY